MSLIKVKCALVSTIILWASAFVGIRMALVDYSPGSLALLRFFVALITLAFIYSCLDIKKIVAWPHRILLLLAGMSGIGVYNVCLNYGELYVSAGTASFIIGLMPVMTVVLSFFVWQERLRLGAKLGICISLIGLLLLALSEGFDIKMVQGMLLILVSAFTGSILTLVQKQFVRQYHPVAIIFWVMCGGTLFLSIFSLTLINELHHAAWLSTGAVVYMGIFPAAVAYLGWCYVLKNITPNQASVSLYALPLISTLLGFIVLSEQPSIWSLIGGGIALIGALIASRYQGVPPVNVPLDKKIIAV